MKLSIYSSCSKKLTAISKFYSTTPDSNHMFDRTQTIEKVHSFQH